MKIAGKYFAAIICMILTAGCACPGNKRAWCPKETSRTIYADYEIEDKRRIIIINISGQLLYLMRNDLIEREYQVSTSAYGVGNEKGSNKTPVGVHRIAAKIGRGAPEGTIFRRQKNTGEIALIYSDKTKLSEDVITSRILVLEEMGDTAKSITMSRGIYIHGTPEEGRIGEPVSRGCIRMKNRDVIELFDMTSKGTVVYFKK